MEELVECINNKNIPNEIPISKHPKLNTPYTVIEAVKCKMQGGILGFKLAEIELGMDTFPYLYWDASRFRLLNNPLNIEKIEKNELIEII